MALPSFSFGAEGVEYGRAASYYATTAGNEVFPDDVEVQGNLTVEGSTTLRGTAVNGTLTVTQSATGGTRTAYLTNGGVGVAEKSVAVFNDQAATLVVMKNSGNEGNVGFDAGVTGGRFNLSKPVNIPVLGGASSGNLTVGGSALVSGGITTTTLTASNQVTFSLGSGTYAVPLVLLPSLPGNVTNGLNGNSGFIRIPYDFTDSQGFLRYGAFVVLPIPATNNSVIIVRPTGQTQLRDAGNLRLSSAVVNVQVAQNIQPVDRTFRLEGFATPSTSDSPINTYMEAYYIVINGAP